MVQILLHGILHLFVIAINNQYCSLLFLTINANQSDAHMKMCVVFHSKLFRRYYMKMNFCFHDWNH